MVEEGHQPVEVSSIKPLNYSVQHRFVEFSKFSVNPQIHKTPKTTVKPMKKKKLIR